MDLSFIAKRLALLGAVFAALAQASPLAIAQSGPKAGGEIISPDEMRVAAVNALQSGHSRAALTMADALLQRDANDVPALIIKARATRNLGAFDAAIAAGKTAWAQANTEDEKYAAAMAVAQALSSDGKRTMAQFWLRRAADKAPNEATRNIAARDFRYVRARNPWSSELSFNIAPSSNINNGSVHETTKLFGLPFDFELNGAARALEGLEYSAGYAGRYRFDQSELYAQDVIFQLNHRTYTLSDSARAMAPGVKGSDFAFSQLGAGYVYQRTPENWVGPFTLNATGGHTWYGGDPYSAYLRLGASQKIDLGASNVVNISGSAERQFGSAAPDADILRADLRFAHGFGQIGTLGLSLGHSDSMSDDTSANFTELRGGIDFHLAQPVLGAQVSFGIDWRQRDFPKSRYDPSGRNDTEVSASVDMTFTQIARYGFNPTISLNTSRTDSNIGLFDSESLGVSFGLRSAF